MKLASLKKFVSACVEDILHLRTLSGPVRICVCILSIKSFRKHCCTYNQVHLKFAQLEKKQILYSFLKSFVYRAWNNERCISKIPENDPSFVHPLPFAFHIEHFQRACNLYSISFVFYRSLVAHFSIIIFPNIVFILSDKDHEGLVKKL